MRDDYQSEIIDLVSEFRKDVMDNSFNNFLFFTYNINSDLLSWFPDNSKVVFYTMPIVKSKLNELIDNSIIINEFNTHAKIYLMWNEKKIVCWLGSFNFTYGSLIDSIEWAQRNEGNLNVSLDVNEIPYHKFSIISNNQFINQVFDLVMKLLKNDNDFLCDKILDNYSISNILLHNNEPNTLILSIKKILNNYKSDLEINYITPFVSRNGVEYFIGLINENLLIKNMELTILTNKPDEKNYLINTYLSGDEINFLKNRNNKLSILRRKTGEGEIILGKEIMLEDSFLHMKLITFAFTNNQNKSEYHGLFTSANLTETAWNPNSNKLEIGVWIRNQTENERIQIFIEKLKENFCEFTSEELKEIDDLSEKLRNVKYKEIWLEDLVKNSLEITKETITLHWKNDFPKITNITCDIHFSNIISREILHRNYHFQKTDNVLQVVNYLDEIPQENIIISSIDVNVSTEFIPPEIELKYFATLIVNENNSLFLKLEEGFLQKWTSIIINNKDYSVERTENRIKLPIQSQIKSISLRKYGETAKFRISVSINQQPHLPSKGFISGKIMGNIQLIRNLILTKIDIKCAKEINPPFDSIDFFDDKGKNVYFVGFSKKSNKISYFFYPQVLPKQLFIRFKNPYNIFFNDILVLKTELKKDIYHQKELLNIESAFFHSLISKLNVKEIDNFITKNSSIEILYDKSLEKVKDFFKNCKIKYFIKEESPIYKEPLIKEISNKVENLNTYSCYSYCGALEFAVDKENTYLLFPKKNFNVKEEPIRDIKIKDELFIPHSIISNSSILFYVVLRYPDDFIFIDNLSERDISLDIIKNDKKMETIKFDILKKEMIWVIPIFKSELEITLSIIVKLTNKNPYYSWYYKVKEYYIERKTNGFKVYPDKNRNQIFPIESNQSTKETKKKEIEKVTFKSSKKIKNIYFETFPKEHILEINSNKDVILFFS